MHRIPFLSFTLIFTFVICKVELCEHDVIHKLPGLNTTARFKQYSGYLTGSLEEVQLHYWLVENAQKPKLLPLILWLNGGPGCSSLLGLFTENGPFSTKSELRLRWNPYSWNKVANILYLETPAEVGFSYYISNSSIPGDNRTSIDNYHALLSFLEKFPSYIGRDIYLAGESYAGVYLPLLALQMIENGIQLNLKGLFIGNPYLGSRIHEVSEYYYLHSRGMIPKSYWDLVNRQCCENQSSQPCLFTDKDTYECYVAVEELDKFIDKEVYPYVNYFNMHKPCANEIAEPTVSETSVATYFLSSQSGRSCKTLRRDNRAALPKTVARIGSGTTACLSNSNLVKYLNNPAVRDALHVSGRFEGRWEECNNAMYTRYHFSYLPMSNQYRKLLENKIPIAFLSGDLDIASAHTGTGWFVGNLKLQTVTPKAAWFYSGRQKRCQLGGFYEKLALNGTTLWYVIVQAAGHMIPTDQPGAALHLIKSFIKSDSPFD